MLEKDLDIFKNEGCLLCEYCTIMHDLTREIQEKIFLSNFFDR